MVRKIHKPLKNTLVGLLAIFALGVFTISIPSTKAEWIVYVPSKYEVVGVKVGVKIFTPDGQPAENYKAIQISKKIVNHFKTGLAEYGLLKPVQTVTFFPEECKFGGAKFANNQTQAEQKGVTLYLYVYVTQEEHGGRPTINMFV